MLEVQQITALPWQVWLAILQFGALAFWKPLVGVRGWLLRCDQRQARRDDAERIRQAAEIDRHAARVSDLEQLVDLLRKALDKHLIRESAVVAAAEVLLLALIGHVPKPTAAVLHARDRALELLELARDQLHRINKGGE